MLQKVHCKNFQTRQQMTAKADCRLQQFNDEGKQSCKWSITQYIDSTPCSNNNKTVTCHYPKWQRTQQQQSHTHTHLTTGTGTVQNERNSQCKQTHDNSTQRECDSPNAPWHSVSGHKNTDCATVVHRSCLLATTHDKTSQQSSRNSDAQHFATGQWTDNEPGSCRTMQAAKVMSRCA